MKVQQVAGGAAVAFGLLTLLSGGKALFGTADMGAVVPFVLWFNFVAGFAYVVGGLLLWRGHRFALPAALAILLATAMVFVAFGLRTASGGAYEMRTVGAMALRAGFWAVMAWTAWKTMTKKSST